MSGRGKAVRAAVAGRDARGQLVDPASGAAVEMSEARRVQLALGDVRGRAAPPDSCSAEIPVAPARGPSVVWRPSVAYITEGGPRVRREPMPAGGPARIVSALDLLELASRRRDGAPVFTVAQHLAAAEYEALFERVHGGRVKCSDLVGAPKGGSGSLMDAIVHDVARLRRMDRAVGAEPVLRPRGARAHAGRRTIRADVLVHWALIRQAPLARLLQRAGWSGKSAHRRVLLDGLAAALDRMHGL